MPTRLWFSSEPLEQAVALAICWRCPVRVECLEEALRVEADGYAFGVRGALTAGERRALAVWPTSPATLDLNVKVHVVCAYMYLPSRSALSPCVG
jgi:Transcription factor WhiB